MANKKILVVTDHMPWGHRSIAKAIYNYIQENKTKEDDYEVRYAEVKAETGFGDELYTFAYRYLPISNRWAYKVFDKKFAKDLIHKISFINLPRLKKEVEKFNPDLVISTFYFHSHSLVDWVKKDNKKFKLWTVVADPWTIHPLTIVNGCDLNLVYDEVGEKEALKCGIKQNGVFKTGWWVRPEMYKKYDRKESRKKLGITDNRPVIFIGGGSLGTSSLTKFLPTLLFIKKKVAFVINTGVDKLAYRLVDRYIKLLAKIRHNDIVCIKNMGWIDNMAEVLSACDIVFGKAGPNFLFDVVAVEKPFVAITHVGGQEDGNIELIKKKELGWIKEKNSELVNFLYKYLDNPKYFQEKYKKSIKKEALTNKNTLKLVLERIRKELK